MTTEIHLKDLLLMKEGDQYRSAVVTNFKAVTSTQEVGELLILSMLTHEVKGDGREPNKYDLSDFEFQWLLASHILGYTSFKLRAHHQSQGKLVGSVVCRFVPQKDHSYTLILEEDKEEEKRTIGTEAIVENETDKSVDDQVNALKEENARLKDNYRSLQLMTQDVSELLTRPNFNIIINSGDKVSEEAAKKLQDAIVGYISTIVVENSEGGLQLKDEYVGETGPDYNKIVVGSVSIVKPYLTAVNVDAVVSNAMGAITELELIDKALKKLNPEFKTFSEGAEITPEGIVMGEFVGMVINVTARVMGTGLGVALIENNPEIEEVVQQ